MAFKRRPPSDNVRRVVCLGKNFRGITTNKSGRLVQFESEQERKLILLLERDPSVAAEIGIILLLGIWPPGENWPFTLVGFKASVSSPSPRSV